MTSRTGRLLASAAAGALAIGVLEMGGATPAHAASDHIVRPGESIQQAVDEADPGDTIQLLPGTYRGSVLITVPGLTLRGAGDATVITPAPEAARAAGGARAGGGTEPAGGDCATPGHGICVLGTAGHPVTDVVIERLTVSGFPKDGISGSATDRMTVREVLVEDNGQQGISQEKSTHGVLVGNRARHNGQAGIYLTNIAYGEGGSIDTEGTVASGNELTGNRMGAVLRRARNLVLEGNTITGNCAGVFVVGDENIPRGGALTVRGNLVNANNNYCASDGRLPYFQGIGIVLTGVEETTVVHNRLEGNVGASPFSGGIVLYRSSKGGPDTSNLISDNLAMNNKPADLADRDGGAGNSFSGNVCGTFEPAGRSC